MYCSLLKKLFHFHYQLLICFLLFWNWFPRSCTSSQSTQQPTSSPTIRIASNLRDSLIAYYPFEHNADDKSGNGNHGTVRGGVTLVADRFGNPSSAYFRIY
jgi:hypothetical protein